ncbi:hypothetical protein D3C80_1324350 [compost metagenome]
MPCGVIAKLYQRIFVLCVPIGLLASAQINRPQLTQLLGDIDLHFAAFGVIKVVIVVPVWMVVVEIIIFVFRIAVITIHMLIGRIRKAIIARSRVAITR